tara:strand:- start:54 stop:440 length:387 start_codon:yes stop_codon:yes gene_type:complete
MIDNEFVKTKIAQLLNNGFAFLEHLDAEQRDEVEKGLVDFYDTNFYGAFVEEEMIYVVDSKYNKILMMEVTKNSIYFNPYNHSSLFDVIYLTLEYVTTKFAKTEEIPEFNEDDSTEDVPKPKPSFDIL